MPRFLALFLSFNLQAMLVGCVTINDEISKHRIQIETTPKGALVSQSNGEGTRTLGPGPVTTEVEYVTSRFEAEGSMWIWPVLTGVLTAIGTAVAVESGTDNTGAFAAGLTTSIIGGTGFLIALPGALISAAQDGDIVREGYGTKGPPTFQATLAGHTQESIVLPPFEPPPSKPLQLKLHPTNNRLGGLGMRKPVGALLGTKMTKKKSWPVIAVFQVQDGGDQLDSKLLDQLTDYLSAKLTESGRYRVVPKEELHRILGKRKRDSYHACVDEACQIELGKAVAAQKSLATKLLRVGNKCALSASLFDLKTETAESGASVRTSCTDDELMDGIDALAAKLSD